MRRRDFIAVLGGAATAWPLAARAQQAALPVIGLLNGRSIDDAAYLVAAFRQGLNEAGYVEGQNVAIEYRWADGHYDRMPAMAADLVNRRVTLIVVTGGSAPLAVKAATKTVPALFVWGGDPVKMGLVASINHPGGNVSGVNILVNVLDNKRLGLMRELVPKGQAIGVLLNPSNPNSSAALREMQEAARALSQSIEVVSASSGRDFEVAFDVLTERRVGGLVVAADAFFVSQRDQLIALAANHSLPAIYHQRKFPQSGGLMSYGTNLADAFRQVASLAARVMKGEKPADIPVMQPTKFELVINLKTANVLGLTIPPGVLAIADEVIE